MTSVNLFLSMGLVAGLLTIGWTSRRPGPTRLLWILGCWTGILGARLAAFGEAVPGQVPGGLSSLGMGTGFVVGVWACGKILYSGRGMTELLDDQTPGLAVALILGRVGCLVAGCHLGAVTEVPWAVTYGSSSAVYAGQLLGGQIDLTRAESLPVHPLPLYEGGFALLGLLALLAFGKQIRHRLPSGTILSLSIAGYATLRVATEIEWGASGMIPLDWLAVAAIMIATSLFIVSSRAVNCTGRKRGDTSEVCT